jgi:hypothetical protein
MVSENLLELSADSGYIIVGLHIHILYCLQVLVFHPSAYMSAIKLRASTVEDVAIWCNTISIY